MIGLGLRSEVLEFIAYYLKLHTGSFMKINDKNGIDGSIRGASLEKNLIDSLCILFKDIVFMV